MGRIMRAASIFGLLVGAVNGIDVDFSNDDSIKQAASTIAYGLLKYYTGNNTGDTPGNLPDPYFWWEAGAMFGTMIDYWFYTGDESYVEVTTQAMIHQADKDRDFMPKNQTSTLGNDDQGFWAMAAMSAAENNFPNPPEDQPQWLALVQAVFNEYVERWDTETCGGGLRWQIFTINIGYNYKNSISNGCFFNIAARLARYTGNQTYADWAGKVWDWMADEVGFIDSDYNVYDGAGVESGCTELSRPQWTYNAGIFLHGAAVMYNFTDMYGGGSDDNNSSSSEVGVWAERVRGLMARTKEHFFDEGGVPVEHPCEPFDDCNIDQQSFKGYLMRWLAASAQVAPFAFDDLMSLVRTSAAAAAPRCSGSPPPESGFRGDPGTACGFRWTGDGGAGFDGLSGVGQQMSALSAVQYTLVKKAEVLKAPATAATGGTSVGDVNAGVSTASKIPTFGPVSLADRVAAGFATTAILFSIIGGSVFVMKD